MNLSERFLKGQVGRHQFELDRRDAMQSSHASLRIWTSAPRGPKLTSRLAPFGSSLDCRYCISAWPPISILDTLLSGSFQGKCSGVCFNSCEATQIVSARTYTTHSEDPSPFGHHSCPGFQGSTSPLDLSESSGLESACRLP